MHLMNLTFNSSKVNECIFLNLEMMNTSFGDVICRNTIFEDVNLMNTDFFNAKFVKCTFKKVKFMNSFNVEKSEFVECVFNDVEAHGESAEELLTKVGLSKKA